MTNNVESKNTYRLSILMSLLSKMMRNGIPTRIPMTKFDLYSFWPNHPPMQTSSRHSCVLRIRKCYEVHRIVHRTSLYLLNCPCNSLYFRNKKECKHALYLFYIAYLINKRNLIKLICIPNCRNVSYKYWSVTASSRSNITSVRQVASNACAAGVGRRCGKFLGI